MADKNLSLPIPDGWTLEIKKKKDGSKVLSFVCPGTGQCFSSYEDMMRYVIYAKNAELPVFVPNFPWWQRNQDAGQSSGSADDQSAVEQKLDLDKGTDLEKSSDSLKGANIEKYLDPEKGTDIEKSLVSNKGTDTKSLDAEKSADAGENLKNVPSNNVSAPAADTITHDDLFLLQQIPNFPPVPARPHGEEKSPLVAIPPAMIQEFSAANPRLRRRASKPRRFRRWGHKKSAAGRSN